MAELASIAFLFLPRDLTDSKFCHKAFFFLPAFPPCNFPGTPNSVLQIPSPIPTSSRFSFHHSPPYPPLACRKKNKPHSFPRRLLVVAPLLPHSERNLVSPFSGFKAPSVANPPQGWNPLPPACNSPFLSWEGTVEDIGPIIFRAFPSSSSPAGLDFTISFFFRVRQF